MRFIEGRTFSENDVREEQNLERILHLIQACHNEIPKHFKGPALVFWPFHVCRNYILTAKDGNSRMMDFFPRFLDINEEIEKSVGKINWYSGIMTCWPLTLSMTANACGYSTGIMPAIAQDFLT